MQRDDVIAILGENWEELRTRFGAKSIALFGSVARGEATERSDVDLLVEFDRPTGYFGLFALQDRIEQLLGCPVDLGTVNSLKPRMRNDVLRERINVTPATARPNSGHLGRDRGN